MAPSTVEDLVRVLMSKRARMRVEDKQVVGQIKTNHRTKQKELPLYLTRHVVFHSVRCLPYTQIR